LELKSQVILVELGSVCLCTMGWFVNLGRYIYVNRGLVSCHPGRVGIMPEITVIEPKKGIK
jgi:predicted MPP superfamily phosphohydrolase